MKTQIKNRLFPPIAALIALATSLDAAQIYDPAPEFSATSNPSGVWSYGYSLTLGGPLILHTDRRSDSGVDIWITDIGFGTPSIVHNPTANAINLGTSVFDAGGLNLHPGPNDEYSILRFTAPLAGDYRVTGSWSGQDSVGTSTDVHLLANGLPVFDGAVTGFGPGTGPAFDTTVTLGAGGYVDFAVGFGGNDVFFDSTGLSARIAVVPEPSALSLLAAGGIALVFLGRRYEAR